MCCSFLLIPKTSPVNNIAVELWNFKFGHLTRASEDFDEVKEIFTGLLIAGFTRKK